MIEGTADSDKICAVQARNRPSCCSSHIQLPQRGRSHPATWRTRMCSRTYEYHLKRVLTQLHCILGCGCERERWDKYAQGAAVVDPCQISIAPANCGDLCTMADTAAAIALCAQPSSRWAGKSTSESSCSDHICIWGASPVHAPCIMRREASHVPH